MAQFDDEINLAMDCCLDYYGDEIIYMPEAGGSYDMVGILDEAVSVVDTSGEIAIETAKPVLSVKISDFDDLGVEHPKQDDKFVIKGKLYSVTHQPEDGWSESRIVLFCEGVYNA